MVGRERHKGMCDALCVNSTLQPHILNTSSPANSCVLGGGASFGGSGLLVRKTLRVSAWSYLLPEFSVCLVGDL